jgi:hypothetical protein
MTTIRWLVLFREKLAVCSDNHKKPINTLCGQNAELLIVEAGGTCGYHCDFKTLKENFSFQLSRSVLRNHS